MRGRAPDPDFFLPYAEALALQQALVEDRIRDAIPDTVLLVEHEPVITLGSATAPAHLRLERDQYARRGIAVAAAGRGGSVTYHGPGQLVMYPIMKLGPDERDAHAYIRRLEEACLRALARFGIEGHRRAGASGVWTRAGKIAAVGIRLKRWVTSHGLALNLDPDPAPFATIVPCGLADTRVASVELLCAPAPAPPMSAAAEALAEALAAVFARRFQVCRGAAARRATA